MPEKLTEFDAAEYIETVEDARQHLELCVEQDPGDGSAIRAALNTIARAQNMSGLARDTELNRAGLYKALSEDGNPTLSTLLKIIGALGLRLRVSSLYQNHHPAARLLHPALLQLRRRKSDYPVCWLRLDSIDRLWAVQ